MASRGQGEYIKFPPAFGCQAAMDTTQLRDTRMARQLPSG